MAKQLFSRDYDGILGRAGHRISTPEGRETLAATVAWVEDVLDGYDPAPDVDILSFALGFVFCALMHDPHNRDTKTRSDLMTALELLLRAGPERVDEARDRDSLTSLDSPEPA